MNRRALIMDAHIGCQLWQRAVLRKLGVECKVLSLRKKRRRLQIDQPPLAAAEARTRSAIQCLWRYKPRRYRWSATDGKLLSLTGGKRGIKALFDESDFFVGGYPPVIGEMLLDLARRHQKRVIFNLANRFTLRTPGDTADFTAVVKEIHQSPEHTLAVMGEYDYQYVRHYLGIEPLKLYTSCHHIPLSKHRPVDETVLLDATPPPRFWGRLRK